MLIGDISRRNAWRFPDKVAITLGDAELTWAALDERANRLGGYLLSRGLEQGDRVAVCAPNTLEWPEIMFGVAKAGLVLVPVNVRLTGPEIEYILEDSGARAAIVGTAEIEKFGPVLGKLDVVIELGTSGELEVSYDAALQRARPVDPTPASLTDDAVDFLLYTSGTTGWPKAVVNEHRGMIAQALDTLLVFEGRHDDVSLAMTPFFTAGGMFRTVAGLYLGQTMVISPRFDPELALYEIERRRVTTTTFVPTMLLRTLQALDEGPPRDISSLRRISYGSAPMLPGLAQATMERLGCELQQRYGCTEAGGQITFLSPADHVAMIEAKPQLTESCGRETPQAEVRVLDESGNPVATGEIGEVVIKADSVARGYWNRPEETAATFRPEGVRSGDLGRLDDEGYLYLAGRMNDMIVSGGFNVYPAELERVLGSDPGVDLVAVVGASHPQWGETPVAVVVPTRSTDVTSLEARLRDLCRAQLASYKQPRAYEFRSELPLSPAGKILKRSIEVHLSES